MDAFSLCRNGIADYDNYVQSFLTIRDERIRKKVQDELSQG